MAVDDGLGWWSALTVADDNVRGRLLRLRPRRIAVIVGRVIILSSSAVNLDNHGSSLFATADSSTADSRSTDDAGSSLAGGVCVDGMVGAEVLDDS